MKRPTLSALPTLFLGCFAFPAFLIATQNETQNPPSVQVVAQAGAPTGATLAQSPGPVAMSSGAPLSVTIPVAPAQGDLIVLFVVSNTPIPVPAGFSTPYASMTPGPVQVFYQLAGASAPTSYSVGSGMMLAQLFDVTDENQSLAPTLSLDPPGTVNSPAVTRAESVLGANGLTLAAFGGSSNTRLNWLSTAAPTSLVSPGLPGGVTATAYPQTVYGTTSMTTNFGLALGVFQVSSEAFNATPNPFTVVGQFSQKSAFMGMATYNGAVLTVLPATTPLQTPNLATPQAGFYISVRYNELSGNNGTYDQSTVPNFELDMSRTLAINSHFHYWTDIFPWGNSTSNPYSESHGTSHAVQSNAYPYNVAYNVANTDEEDDVVNGRYVLTTWNCGDTDWRVAHGVDDDQIIATAYRFKAYGQPIFVRYFHEMNLEAGTDQHQPCLDSADNPSGDNLSGDVTPAPMTTGGYFNPGEWKAAWIHVHDLVRSIAPNVNFVWVPSGGGMSDSHSFQPSLYYPGDQYVEWTGFDDYERRAFPDFDSYSGTMPGVCSASDAQPTPGPTYYCPNTIYTEVTGAYQNTQGTWTTPVQKPLFVAETAVTPAAQSTWLATAGSGQSIIAQTLPAIYPRIAALAYFDENGGTSWVLTGAPTTPSPIQSAGTGYALFKTLATASATGPPALPTPATANPVYTINHGPLATSSNSTITVRPSAMPALGDTLVAAIVTVDQFSGSLGLPTGWTILTSPPTTPSGYLETAYCVVATSCSAASSYAFPITSGGGIAQIFDITSASTTATPMAASDLPTSFPTGLNTINELVTNLQVPATGGFAMTIWAANAGASVLNYPGSSTTNPLFEIYPSYGTLFSHSTNVPVGNSYLSLVSFKINREIKSSNPFTAAARYYNNIPSIPASPTPMPTVSTGPVNADGTTIWLHP